jgi:predicted GNAT family N-acyltransferase
VAVLNDYLARQASQDVRRRVAACFVAVHQPDGRLAGYYTLSAGSVLLMNLPDDQVRKLPRYPSVPVARIGRLAVSLAFQGQKLGASLVADAIQRVVQSEVAMFAVVVDAKDERAASFYRHFGFRPLLADDRALFLPLDHALRNLAGQS